MLTITGAWQHFRDELRACDATLLRYPQRAFQFTVDNDGDAQTVLVDQNFADVGSSVWDGEVVLAHHVYEQMRARVAGAAVLELGCVKPLTISCVCSRDTTPSLSI